MSMHFKPLLAAFGRGLPPNSGGYVETPYGVQLESRLNTRGIDPEAISSAMFHNTRFLHYLKEKLGYSSEQDVQQYITFLQENDAPQAAALDSAALQFFFLHVLGHGPEEHSSRGRRLPLLLSSKETDTLLQSATSLQDKIFLELLTSCGLRLEEVTGITRVDIDLKHKALSVGERTVPLPFTLLKHLEFYLRLKTGSGSLFSSSGGRPLPLPDAQKKLDHLARRAGLDIQPDSLRFSYAAHLLQQGSDLSEIQYLLGHSETAAN